jgi:AhpD family alkylhydroperoxidase
VGAVQLELTEKELVAIGASIGAGCRPCIEHHIPMAREAGLPEAELTQAVNSAFALRSQATELFAARVDELLGGSPAAPPTAATEASAAGELVALGVSVGANSHPLLRRHIAGALEAGLRASQIDAALRTAEYVQERAAEMTADKAAEALGGARHRLERSTT